MANSAIEYLEDLQKEALKRVGMHKRPSPERSKAANSIAVDTMHGWRIDATELEAVTAQSFQRRATKFEDPAVIQILDGLQQRVVTALERNGQSVRTDFVFGSLPIGSMNAAAIYHQESEQFLVVLQTGIFRFLNLFCKAIVQALPLGVRNAQKFVDLSNAESVNSISEKPEAVRRLIDLLEAYVVDGDATHALPYLRPTEHEQLVQHILAVSETFVLCHEFGHIELGHLNGSTVVALSLPGHDAHQASTSHQQEFDADAFGLDLVFRAFAPKADPASISIAYFGVEVFFAAVQLVDRCIETLVGPNRSAVSNGNTHPLVEDRRAALREITEAKFAEFGHAVVSYGSMLDKVLAVLWTPIESYFQDLRAKGVRPDVAWYPSQESQLSDQVRSQIPWRCVRSILEGIKSNDAEIFLFFSEYAKAFSEMIAVTLLENSITREDDIGNFCRQELEWLEDGLSVKALEAADAMRLPDMERPNDDTFMQAFASIRRAIQLKAISRTGAQKRKKAKGPMQLEEEDGAERQFEELSALGSIVLNLRSPNAELRKITAEHLRQIPPEVVVQSFLVGLSHTNTSVRELSADILLAIDPSFKYKRREVENYLRSGERNAQPLQEFVQDTVQSLVGLMRNASDEKDEYEMLHGFATVVINLRNPNAEVREAAVSILTQMKPGEVLMPLISSLVHSDAAIRALAEGALATINPKMSSAVGAIRRLLAAGDHENPQFVDFSIDTAKLLIDRVLGADSNAGRSWKKYLES